MDTLVVGRNKYRDTRREILEFAQKNRVSGQEGGSMNIQNIIRRQASHIEALLRALHAFPAGEESQVIGVKESLLGLIQVLPPEPSWRWSMAFRLLGEMHPGIHRYDIILGILMTLDEFRRDPETESVVPVWARVWMCVLPKAKIHPASLGMCTVYGFRGLRKTLFKICTTITQSIDIKFIPSDEETEDTWDVLFLGPNPEIDLLSIGQVYVGHLDGAQYETLGAGWVVAGDFRIDNFQNLNNLGPDLNVFGCLQFGWNHRIKKVRGPVRVAFLVSGGRGGFTTHRSGFAGIISNIGYQKNGNATHQRAGRYKQGKARGSELNIPYSLGILSPLGLP